MAEVKMIQTFDEDEFLTSWFPDLDRKSYIIPVAHFDHIHANIMNHGDVSTGVLRPKDNCSIPTAQKIKERDDTHTTVHSLFTKVKEYTAKEEVMMMMTQTSFSMYSSPVTAARASDRVRKTGHAPLEDIRYQKQNHSDLVIVNRKRGVLLGVVLSVHAADPTLASKKLEETLTSLTKASKSIHEVVRTVPGAEKVAVHTTLVLTNITRAQLEWHLTRLEKAVERVPCLCKDELTSDKGLKPWWEACWSSRHLDLMDSDVYRHLVARFAVPATKVEIYLTTQPRLQLKHDQDVVDAVGDVHGAEVFQAGLHQLSLFPKQAGLLDFDCMDETEHDLKFLWGPPGTGKTILLVLRALQWVKHFSARHIVILQTRQDGTAASCLVEYQLQQTLNAQPSGTDILSAQCTFTHVDAWSEKWDRRRSWLGLDEEGKKKLSMALGLQQHDPSDTAIHIVADEADGYVVADVYQWLEDKGVATIRLWAASVMAFPVKENIPASLQHAVCHVTEPLRCPGPVVEEVMKAMQLTGGDVPRYDVGWKLTGGPPIEHLPHCCRGRDGHTGDCPWRCGQCAKNIAARLKSLHVGQADERLQALSANDVFVLSTDMDCDAANLDGRSPAPLINGLRDKGYNVRTLSHKSTRDEVMAVAKRDVQPPAIIVTNEKFVWGLERKIVVYCEAAFEKLERLRAFSRTTSLLIYVKAQAV